MRKPMFSAERAFRNLQRICAVSQFIPAGMDPYKLQGPELERYLASSRRRADVVTRTFRCLGYTVSRTSVPYQGFQGVNLFAYRGRKDAPGRLLVVGHHDYCAGTGAEDNGTALAVMLELARVCSSRTDICFASFDLEEPGLVGSKQLAETLAKSDRLNFEAVIDLECLGSGKHVVICRKVYGADSDPALVAQMRSAARNAGYNLPVRSYDYFWADHVPFAQRGLKTLELGSINALKKLSKSEREAEFKRAMQGRRRKDGSVAHTRFDLPESIRIDNLQKVGDVLLEFLSQVR